MEGAQQLLSPTRPSNLSSDLHVFPSATLHPTPHFPSFFPARAASSGAKVGGWKPSSGLAYGGARGRWAGPLPWEGVADRRPQPAWLRDPQRRVTGEASGPVSRDPNLISHPAERSLDVRSEADGVAPAGGHGVDKEPETVSHREVKKGGAAPGEEDSGSSRRECRGLGWGARWSRSWALRAQPSGQGPGRGSESPLPPHP